MPPRTLVLALVLGLTAAAHAETIPADKTLHLYTADGRWKTGKWSALEGDSLLVGKTRLARAEIDRAWVTRRDVATHALTSAVTGLVGGAFIELVLGGNDAGGVAKAAGIGAGLGALSGLLSSALVGDDGWRQVIPEPSSGHGVDPFPTWGATVRGGEAWRRSLGAPSSDPTFGFTIWRFGSPNVSLGAEYGGLEFRTERFASDDSLGRTFIDQRSRTAYATSLLRWRGAGERFKPQVILGFGEYFFRDSGTVTVQDTLGTTVQQGEFRETDTSWGVNLGVGVGGLGGDFHPGIEARLHWPFDAHTTYYTVAAFVDFR
jgi:hypothetical protein